jgi:hypothetical protein
MLLDSKFDVYLWTHFIFDYIQFLALFIQKFLCKAIQLL